MVRPAPGRECNGAKAYDPAPIPFLGEHEKTLKRLESRLEMPCYLSPGWLAKDPNFAPPKGSVDFEKRLKKTVRGRGSPTCAPSSVTPEVTSGGSSVVQ